VEVEDLLTGGRFQLHGKWQQVSLDPHHYPAAIWRIRRTG